MVIINTTVWKEIKIIEISLYYDARSKKHNKIIVVVFTLTFHILSSAIYFKLTSSTGESKISFILMSYLGIKLLPHVPCSVLYKLLSGPGVRSKLL